MDQLLNEPNDERPARIERGDLLPVEVAAQVVGDGLVVPGEKLPVVILEFSFSVAS